ncbi:MAG: bifunctional DNA-formamidopyrimidine glycosylase/DNA-(apurinic or apyrimidinic site) lyase [Candidatus Zambryskibacteria bacterium]|nr:bifunctional DNA-formamidopyrimidine glycosylase/DNA-(apurinic or apyrimidinic site) lyase [Candidatus Zambryskibacteria bacterium]
MPELPEVQTTVNGLNKIVKGRKITGVWSDYRRNSVPSSIIGAKIRETRRRGKNILINLSNGETLLVHMKMTGHFVYNRPNYPYVHFRLTLDNGKILSLSDMRRFAKVITIDTKDLKKSPHLEHLGPEPLDKNFQFKIFNFQLMKRPSGKIKSVLMDQSLIAGIGNIYSDEILWRAGVHPLSLPKAIPEKQFKLMFNAMKKVLNESIDFGGDSMSDYRNIDGEKGEFQEHHRAYRRTGKKCTKPGCKGIIARLVVGTRSAHFCPVHQKLFK